MSTPQEQIENQSRASAPQAPPLAPYPSSRETYYRADPRSKSPFLAVILSAMPGLGQIYVGYYQQGFINILVIASLIAILNAGAGSLEPLVSIFVAFFWLYNVVDAGRRAALYNQALAGLSSGALPDEAKLSSGRGSLIAGIALVVFGSLFLAHTTLGYSLEWLEDWWPLAMVIVGAFLVAKDFKERFQKPSEE